MTDPDLPQPGWYPDPSGAPALRWWNGVTWGDATHPLSPDVPAPEVRSVPPTAPLPTTQVWAPVVPPDTVVEAPESDAPRRRWWLPVVAVVALLGLAAVAFSALVGLGGPRRLDTDAIEQRIAAELSRDAGRPINVTCPRSIALKAGSTFTCTASDSTGDQVLISVRQTSDRGDVVWVPQ